MGIKELEGAVGGVLTLTLISALMEKMDKVMQVGVESAVIPISGCPEELADDVLAYYLDTLRKENEKREDPKEGMFRIGDHVLLSKAPDPVGDDFTVRIHFDRTRRVHPDGTRWEDEDA